MRKRNLRPILILLFTGSALVITYILLVSYIENAIKDKLVAINASSGSVRVNLFTRSLNLEQVEIHPSSEIPISLRIKTVDVQGIHLFSLLIKKTMVINSMQLDSGKLRYENPIKKGSFHSTLEGVHIKQLSLVNIVNEISSDSAMNFSSVLTCGVTDVTFKIGSGRLDYSLKTFEGGAKDIKINWHEGMYSMKIKELNYSSLAEKVKIDSILLIPSYGKFEFAHQRGEQVGRISLSVPQLSIAGISITEVFDTTFTATKIEIRSFDLYSFKDKRVPFLRTKHIPLPIQSFQEIHYPITVDSIVVKESRVTLEEITEQGAEIGTVTIDHVNAACGLVTNRYQEGIPKYAVLKASGVLMDQGEISAEFSLPLDGSATYLTTGRISNFPFKKLNPALEALRFRIESGFINDLKFDFHYTDFQSIGTLTIDYEDLRVIGLKKDTDDPSGFKTFIINAILKTNKDGTLSKMERTGSINIERDRKRYIFNVWWKSLLDGLRSSILESNKVQNQKQ